MHQDIICSNVNTQVNCSLTNKLRDSFLIKIKRFSLKIINLKMLSAKCALFCLGLNVWTMSFGYGQDARPNQDICMDVLNGHLPTCELPKIED